MARERKDKVWMLCETWRLEGGRASPWAVACKDYKTCRRMLKHAVKARIWENYHGRDDAEELSEKCAREVLSHPVEAGRRGRKYEYSSGDREVPLRSPRRQIR